MACTKSQGPSKIETPMLYATLDQIYRDRSASRSLSLTISLLLRSGRGHCSAIEEGGRYDAGEALAESEARPARRKTDRHGLRQAGSILSFRHGFLAINALLALAVFKQAVGVVMVEFGCRE